MSNQTVGFGTRTGRSPAGVAESGVTKRTLYDRFGSKDGLVTTYLRVRDRRWRSMVVARLEEAGTDPVARGLAPFDVLPDWLLEQSRATLVEECRQNTETP